MTQTRGTYGPPRAAWHATATPEALAALDSEPAGLTAAEAARRLETCGPNRLPAAVRRSAWARLLQQFRNLFIYVLLGSAAISLLLGHPVDAAVILAVVLLNAAIGYVQEGRAEQALDAIRAMIDPRAAVIREGRRVTVAADDVVPGDVVVLEAGDRVPADLRLIRQRSLRIAEAALTGESVAVDKDIDPVAADSPLGDRRSMAYSGTLVAGGQGLGVAVATGAATELGRISALLEEVGSLETPLTTADGPIRAAAHRRHRRGLRDRVRLGPPAARLPARRSVHGHRRPRRGRHPRGPARDPDHRDGDRRPPHGRPQRHRAAPAGGRDPRLRQRDLLRQDRHAHPQRDDGRRRSHDADGACEVSGNGYAPHGGFSRDGRDVDPAHTARARGPGARRRAVQRRRPARRRRRLAAWTATRWKARSSRSASRPASRPTACGATCRATTRSRSTPRTASWSPCTTATKSGAFAVVKGAPRAPCSTCAPASSRRAARAARRRLLAGRDRAPGRPAASAVLAFALRPMPAGKHHPGFRRRRPPTRSSSA